MRGWQEPFPAVGKRASSDASNAELFCHWVAALPFDDFSAWFAEDKTKPLCSTISRGLFEEFPTTDEPPCQRIGDGLFELLCADIAQ